MTGLVKVILKSSNETRTSTSSVSDDGSLTFSAAANTKYQITYYLMASGPASGGWKCGMNVPSGSTGYFGSTFDYDDVSSSWGSRSVGSTKSSTALLSGTVPASSMATSGRTGIGIRAAVETSSTAGSITLQWAQNSSNASATTIYQNSFMIVETVSGSGGTVVSTAPSSGDLIYGSTSLTDLTGVSASLASNEVVLVTAYLNTVIPSNTPDLKIGWSYPSGCTGYWGWGSSFTSTAGGYFIGPTGTVTSLAAESGTMASGHYSGRRSGLMVVGIFINSSTSGTLQLRVAQNSSSASSIQVYGEGTFMQTYRTT